MALLSYRIAAVASGISNESGLQPRNANPAPTESDTAMIFCLNALGLHVIMVELGRLVPRELVVYWSPRTNTITLRQPIPDLHAQPRYKAVTCLGQYIKGALAQSKDKSQEVIEVSAPLRHLSVSLST